MTETVSSVGRISGRSSDDLAPVYASAQMQRLRHSVRENSPVYVYARVYNAIKELLLSGTLEPGQRLPTSNELANFLHVAHTTIRRAMRQLAGDGLVVIVSSQGNFVPPVDRVDDRHGR